MQVPTSTLNVYQFRRVVLTVLCWILVCELGVLVWRWLSKHLLSHFFSSLLALNCVFQWNCGGSSTVWCCLLCFVFRSKSDGVVFLWALLPRVRCWRSFSVEMMVFMSHWSVLWDGTMENLGRPCSGRSVARADWCIGPRIDDAVTWDEFWRTLPWDLAIVFVGFQVSGENNFLYDAAVGCLVLNTSVCGGRQWQTGLFSCKWP